MTHRAIKDMPPSGDKPTGYDKTQLRLYLRLLDADQEGADWREIVEVIFRIDPANEPDRALKMFTSHLERARWLAGSGYLKLLLAGPG